MNDDPRYISGTILTRTAKEEGLDRFEELMTGRIASFEDEVYLDLKKLKLTTIKELVKALGAKGSS